MMISLILFPIYYCNERRAESAREMRGDSQTDHRLTINPVSIWSVAEASVF